MQQNIQDLQALYASVRELSAVLTELGWKDFAQDLESALYGSTSGEILANLGAELRRIHEHEVYAHETVKNYVDTEISWIEKALDYQNAPQTP